VTGHDGFEVTAAAPAVRLGPARLRALAARLSSRDHASLHAIAPGSEEDVTAIIEAYQAAPDVSAEAAAAYLRGMAGAIEHREAAVQVESVWSGPTTHPVPVRSTAQVLSQVVGRAGHELLLMTYSAKPYEPLRDALAAAVARKVRVRVVVETLQGAGSAISGEEPAAAFRGLGIELWHWPVTRRSGQKGRMHAKIAVADRRELLVSSANLTESGVTANIEAGLLVRGGTAPERAAEHFDALRAAGVLERL
jgi:phosphatidylserine/phosphatidylglycerophosphate/cardiolipin synthase-like enzyme